MNAEEMTRAQLLAVIHGIRDVLWLVGEAHTSDKEWRPEALEAIADILNGAGLGLVSDPAPDQADLDDHRHQAAEQAFADCALGDAVVAGTSGWEHRTGADEWSCVFFVEDPPGPSVRELFVVRFKPGSAEVEEAYGIC